MCLTGIDSMKFIDMGGFSPLWVAPFPNHGILNCVRVKKVSWTQASKTLGTHAFISLWSYHWMWLYVPAFTDPEWGTVAWTCQLKKRKKFSPKLLCASIPFHRAINKSITITFFASVITHLSKRNVRGEELFVTLNLKVYPIMMEIEC